MNTNMIKKLSYVANSLDLKGFAKEADRLDEIILKFSQSDEQKIGAPDVVTQSGLSISPGGDLYSVEDMRDLLLDAEAPIEPEEVGIPMVLDFVKSLMIADRKISFERADDGSIQYSRQSSGESVERMKSISELKKTVNALRAGLNLSGDEQKDFGTLVSMFKGDVKNIIDEARRNESASKEDNFQRMLHDSKLKEVETKNPELHAAMSTNTPYSEEVRAILGGEYSIMSLIENGTTSEVKRVAAETGAKMMKSKINERQDALVADIKNKLIQKKNSIFAEPNLARAKQEELIAAIELLDKEIKKNKHSKKRRGEAVKERKRMLAEYEFYFDEEAPRSRSLIKRKRKLVTILRGMIPGMDIVPRTDDGKPISWGKLDRSIRERQRALDEQNPYIMELTKMIGSIDFWTREMQQPFTSLEVYDLIKAWVYDVPRQDLPKNLSVDIPRYGYISTRRDPRLVNQVLQYISSPGVLDVPFTTNPPFKSERMRAITPDGEAGEVFDTQAPEDVVSPESRVEMFSRQVEEWGGPSTKRSRPPMIPDDPEVKEVPLEDDEGQSLLNPVLRPEDVATINKSSKRNIAKELIYLANHLDQIGYGAGADIIDGIIS